MKLFEILTEQKSSLRAMSFSQYSSIASVLDLAEVSTGHSETCEYLDFSHNKLYAVASSKCINLY